MPKSTRKKPVQSVPKPSLQQKLLKIAGKTLPKKNSSGIKIRLFDALPAINIYRSPKNEFVLAIKKSGKRITYFTQDQNPKRYFKRWKLKLLETDLQYFCVLGKAPIVKDKTPFQSCREIINNLKTRSAPSLQGTTDRSVMSMEQMDTIFRSNNVEPESDKNLKSFDPNNMDWD